MESLIYHLLYEFDVDYHWSKKILNETRGVVSGLHDIVNFLCDKTRGQIMDCVRLKTEITQTYDGTIKGKYQGAFFENYHLELTTTYSQRGNKPKYSGGFITRYSFNNTETGIQCSPFIRLSVTCNDVQKIYDTVLFCLGHELTHAYDMFEYARKNGLGLEDIMDNLMFGQNYSGMLQGLQNSTGNKKFISDLLYSLNRMERNAYIAQLRQELAAEPIYNSSEALRAIKRSSSYGRFLGVEKKIYTLLDPALDDTQKEELIKYTNVFADKKFTNYEQVKKYYAGRWAVWKKKYLSSASKIAHDIYLNAKENHPIKEDFIGEIGL